jgi:hypothetical protein
MDNIKAEDGEEEIRKTTVRAFKKVMDSIRREPSVILMSDNVDSKSDYPINEITSWLFRRRQDNDDTSN